MFLTLLASGSRTLTCNSLHTRSTLCKRVRNVLGCYCREARRLEDLARESTAVQSIIDPCVPTWPAQEAQAFMQLALRCAPGCRSQRTAA